MRLTHTSARPRSTRPGAARVYRRPAVSASRRDRWAGILAGPVDGHEKLRRTWREVEARVGDVVEHAASGFTGAIARLEKDAVVLRGRTGLERTFRLQPGAFSVAGEDVTLVPPRGAARPSSVRTASGSTAVRAGARVAQASRIWVEGVHDAELVEKVWGDDLRVEGIVVERLDGVDLLEREIARFAPGPGRRLGVLVDHLVPGSKEARLAAAVRHPHVLVAGTPFVDVWQAIRPKALGIAAWPDVPRGVHWKDGVCAALGWRGEPGAVWRTLLARVQTYADLEPALVGAVESLIDFVTDPSSAE